MAFFLSTNGHLTPYQFDYLQGKNAKVGRLEKTKIHNEEKPLAARMYFEQVELYGIDVMNRPIFTMPSDTHLDKVREEMQKKNIRHIPIVNNKKLIGMISDRDLLKLKLSGAFTFLKAEEIMTTVIVVTEEETTIADIARVFVEEKISALPVIDKDHNLVGMISRTDILKAVVEHRLVVR